MNQLCFLLTTAARDHGITWGWKQDTAVLFDESNRPSWVLYVDLPIVEASFSSIRPPSGRAALQVSYHSPQKGPGPAYEGDWDGIRGVSDRRAIDWAEYVLSGAAGRDLKRS
jgi:hypothetical protein